MLTATFILGLLAQGGPPLQTDDAGTPGDGKVELNVAFVIERTKPRTTFEAPLLDFNYGIGERMQLKAELPWLTVDEDSGPAKSGLGNTRLGFKYRFLDEQRSGVSVSVFPQYELDNPTSSEERGLVDGDTELFLPFQAQRSLGIVDASVELGYSFRQNAPDGWTCGLAAGHDLHERFELVAELHGEIARHQHHMDFNVGARWTLSDRCRLLFSAGRSVLSSPGEDVELQSYLGFQVFF